MRPEEDRAAQWTDAMRAQDYGRAWRLSEQALAERDPATCDDPRLPYHLRWVWDGTPVDGRHCLVRCYHGLGDTIQFARFLPLLAQRAASVTVEIQARLLGLFGNDAGAERPLRFAPFDEARPLSPAECTLEITELAFALRATPGDAPSPYLSAPAALLPRGTVGVCHQAGDWDPDRSIPPELLAPLCAAAPCLSLVPGPAAPGMRNPAGCPFDISATASLVAAAELVVTVDTMVAHLAGALGRPTWLLLKADADWRWPKDARRTPWYPTMRLYAQPAPGDWRSVIAEVRCDLAASIPAAAQR